ncbi:hypothetical protein [Streptomyces albus]|uniref:hypothetical protein n=1 Tax=Streptomyces TaxID=1883 RepID=UPI0013B49484|nr:hypothetical protein [Streptomyces albus]QID39226.1 hypothetical protein G3260_006043 [Streptomyces albus]
MSRTAPGKAASEAAPPGAEAGPSAPAPPARRRGPLRRIPRWWPLPVCAVLGVAGGAGYAEVAEPRYEASSYVLVSPGARADTASALGYAQAYGKIATDAVVLTAAETRAKLPRGVLRAHVRSSTSPDAPMVQITGDSPRPGRAADYADAVARSLTRTAKQSAHRTGVRLTVVSPAAATLKPVFPSLPVAVAVGASAGGLVGGLLLLVRPQRRRDTGAAPVPAPAPGGDGTADTSPASGQSGEAGQRSDELEAAR